MVSIFWIILAVLLILAAVYDLAFRLIPLWLILVLVLYVLLSSAIFSVPLSILPALLGAVVVGCLVLTVYLVTRGRGLGEADIIIAAVIGMLFSWSKGLIVFAAANFIALIVVLIMRGFFSSKKMKYIPLVFFLVIAIFLEMFVGYSGLVLRLMGF